MLIAIEEGIGVHLGLKGSCRARRGKTTGLYLLTMLPGGKRIISMWRQECIYDMRTIVAVGGGCNESVSIKIVIKLPQK